MKTTKNKLSLAVSLALGVSSLTSLSVHAAQTCDAGYALMNYNGVNQCIQNPPAGQQIRFNYNGYSGGYFSNTETCPTGSTNVNGSCIVYSCPTGTLSGTSCIIKENVHNYWQNLSCPTDQVLKNPAVTSFNPYNNTLAEFKCVRTDITINKIPTITPSFTTNTKEISPFSINLVANNPDGGTDGTSKMVLSVGKNGIFSVPSIVENSSNSGALSATLKSTSGKVRKSTGSVTETVTAKITDKLGAWVEETYYVTTSYSDIVPTINSNDIEQNEQTTVKLESVTGDADNIDPLIIDWEQTFGKTLTITDKNKNTAYITLPLRKMYDGPEYFKFNAIVKDEDGNTVKKEITVKSNPVNANPIIDLMPNEITVNEKTAFNINTTSSDTDGFVKTWKWEWVSGLKMKEDISTNTSEYKGLSDTQLVKNGVGESYYKLTITDDEGGTASKTVRININPVNIKPVAEAGPNKTITEQTLYNFEENSYDPDGVNSDGTPNTLFGLTYKWEQISGTAVTINNPNSKNASFTTPKRIETLGTEPLVFRLTVTDIDGESSSDTVTITNLPVNIQPIADAGDDLRVPEQQLVTLSGVRSKDPDSATTKFSWKQISGIPVSLSNPDSATPKFTTPIRNMKDQKKDGDGVLEFELSYTDEDLITVKDTVKVNYYAVNKLPFAVPGNDITLMEKTNILLNGENSYDEDGFIEAYRWEIIESAPDSEITINDSNSKKANYMSPEQWVNKPTKYNIIRLYVTDNDGEEGFKDIKVSYKGINEAPKITEIPTEITVNEKTAFTIPIKTLDIDGTVDKIEWKKESGVNLGQVIDDASSTFSAVSPVVRFRDGIVESKYRVTITDNEGYTDSKVVTIKIVPINEVIVPEIDYIFGENPDNERKQDGSTYTQDLKTSSFVAKSFDTYTFKLSALRSYDPDEDGSIISYQWTQLNGGQLSVDISDSTKPETNVKVPFTNFRDGMKLVPMQLKMIDSDGAIKTQTFTIEVHPFNLKPKLIQNAVVDLDELSDILFEDKFSSDEDGFIELREWTSVGNISLRNVNSSMNDQSPITGNKIHVYTPVVLENESAQTAQIKLKVTDNEGFTDEATITVNLKPKNSAPTVNIGNDRMIKGSNKVFLTPLYQDTDGSIDKIEYRVIAGHPLTITSKEGVGEFISPNPPEGSVLNSTIEVVVTDNEGSTATSQMKFRFEHGADRLHTTQNQQTFAIQKDLKSYDGKSLASIDTPVITDDENRVVRGYLPVIITSDQDIIVNGYEIFKNTPKSIDYFSEDGRISMPVWAMYKDQKFTANITLSLPYLTSRIIVKDYNGIKYWSDRSYANSCKDYRAKSISDPYQYWGDTGSGIYRIQTSNGDLKDVYCDMFTNGGGWTTILDTTNDNIAEQSKNWTTNDYGLNYTEVMVDGSGLISDYDKSSPNWNFNGLFLGNRVYQNGVSTGLISKDITFASGLYKLNDVTVLTTPLAYNGGVAINKNDIVVRKYTKNNNTCLFSRTNIPMLCSDTIIFKNSGKITGFTDMESETGHASTDNLIKGKVKILVR